jgi:uncharacterized protein (TIGR03083 family)
VTHVDRATATAALEAAFGSVEALLVELAPDEWHRPTALPGWDVQANAVHIFSTEAMLLGEPAPDVEIDRGALPHIRNDIGAANEAWVQGWADAGPDEVLAGLRDRVARRLAEIRAMDDAAWDTEGFTPAGVDTYGRFMRIRVMDVWMHEQDIREAVDRPGHVEGPVVELVLDEIASGLGFVVGKRAGAAQGSSVSFELAGNPGREVHVAVDGRAAVVDRLDGPATATLRTDVLTFTRLAGGRSSDAGGVTVEGDADLGGRVLANLAFMI